MGGLVVIDALVVNQLIGVRGRPMSPREQTAAAAHAGH
jgi:hypothetical protein